MWKYRSKICEILQKMHKFAEGFNFEKTSSKSKKSILSANRFLVAEYLDGIHDLDKILVSLEQPTELLDPNLEEQFLAYENAEEKRLEHILGLLEYEVDGLDTVSLIIGRHQIERVSARIGSNELKVFTNMIFRISSPSCTFFSSDTSKSSTRPVK
jgi:hypothetical protein